MQKQVPSIGKILTMVAFALSCFGILLYLWTTFGGPIPFKPHGYQVKFSLPQASQLTKESDVRISGIDVGKVESVKLVDNRAQVTVELDSKYAPIAADTRAIRRGKTLLNEAYLELTPGSSDAEEVPDGGQLATTQVGDSVDLDQILLTFDPQTRRAFQRWLSEMAVSVNGRGYELNSAIGNFSDLAQNLDRFAEILNRDREAVRLLVKNGAETFGAISENEDQLRSLIVNSNRIFRATARSSSQFAAAIELLPQFLAESRKTLVRFDRFGDDHNATVRELTSLAKDAEPVLSYINDLAPDFERFATGLGPLFEASEKGVPAANNVIDNLRPLLNQFYSSLLDLKPILEWLAQYDRETVAFFANLAAATEATDNPSGSPRPVHSLRATPTLGAESFAPYSSRLTSNRSNNYPRPDINALLSSGLQVFDSASNCTSNPVPTVGATNPAELKQLMDEYIFNLLPATAPACSQQAASTFQGRTSEFAHVEADADQR